MAVYRIDGVEYKIDDSLDLNETVAQIRASDSHKEETRTKIPEAVKPYIPFGSQSDIARPPGFELNQEQLKEDFHNYPGYRQIAEAPVGAGESILSMGTGYAGLIAGGVAGGVASMIPGSPAGVGQHVMDEVAHKMTYQPRSTAGQIMTNAMATGYDWAKGTVGKGTEADYLRPNSVEPDAALHQGQAIRRGLGEAAFDAAINLTPLGVAARLRGRRIAETELRSQREHIIKEQEAQRAAEEEALRTSDVDVAGWQQRAPFQDYVPTRPPLYVDSRGVVSERLTDRSAFEQSPELQGREALDQARRQPQEPSAPQPTGLEPGLSLAEPRAAEAPAPQMAGIDFKLRQEVLDSPEVKQIVESYRLEEKRMIEEGASKEELATLRNAFGEYMAKYGVRSPEDATGLRRPLYDSEAKNQTARDAQFTDPNPKGAFPIDPFKTALPIEKTPTYRGPRNQQGYIDFTVFKDGLGRLDKWLSESLFKMPMYHGTSQRFRRFDEGPNNKQFGHHFGTMEQANQIGRSKSQSHRIESVYLNVRNPIELPDLGNWTPRAIWSALLEKFPEDAKLRALGDTKGSEGLLRQQDRGTYNYRFTPRTTEGYYNNRSIESFNKALWQYLNDKGFDGIAYYNHAEGSPTKIVSGERVLNLSNLSVIVQDNKQIAVAPKPPYRTFEPSESPRLSRQRKSLDEATPTDPSIGMDPFTGPGSNQAGAIRFGKKETFKDFKTATNKLIGETPEAVLRAMWDEKQKGAPKFKSKIHEGTTNVMQGVPGLKQAMQDLIINNRPFEEALPELQAGGDAPGHFGSRAMRQLLSGGKVVARYYAVPLIKYGVDLVNTAKQAVSRNAWDLLFSKDRGIIEAFDNLSGKDQISLWKVIRDNEGTKWLTGEELRSAGLNDKQVVTYQKHQQGVAFMLKEINAIRESKKQAPIPDRPGYFPAKFIGDWYVRVTAPNPVTGNHNLIGIYSANNSWKVKSFAEKIMKDHPDYEVSKLIERSSYARKYGSLDTFRVFRDITNVLEANDPRAKMLSDVIKEYEAGQADYTAGLFQHAKFKKGIEGSTGKNEYKSDLQNAHDAFKALNDYIQQGLEYVETNKIQPTMSKLLDQTTFAEHPNAQKYLKQYWDRSRGINNKFAQLANDVVTAVAHAFGISGGQVKNVTGAVKAQLMLMLLGYNNPRFLAAQFLQPNQFLMQNMQSLAARGADVSTLSMAQAWAKGIYNTGRSITGREGMDPSARAALKWAEDNRIVEPKMFEDIQTQMQKKANTAFGFINGEWAIRISEEKARIQAFMTFHALLEDAGIKGKENYQVAADLTRHAMTDYRPHEKPLLYQNLGIIGDMISPLTTFKHNYYSQMAVMLKELKRAEWKDKDKYMVPILTTLGIQQLMSGLMGLPGREDAEMIMGWLKEWYPDWRDATQVILHSDLPNYVTHGVSAITGIDMSPTFGAASLIPDRGSELMPLGAKAFDMGKSLVDLAKKRTSGSAWAAAQQFTPNAFQGFLERAMTPASGVVPDPKKQMQGSVRRPLNGESNELIDPWTARYLGTRSIAESKEKTATYKEGLDEKHVTERKALLMERAFDAWTSGKPIDKFYAEAATYGMTPTELVENLKRAMKERDTTVKERFGGLPPRTPNQIRKYEDIQRYK